MPDVLRALWGSVPPSWQIVLVFALAIGGFSVLFVWAAMRGARRVEVLEQEVERRTRARRLHDTSTVDDIDPWSAA